MESKRLLLAIVCSILVIIIWRHVSEIIWPVPPQDQRSGAPAVVLPVPSDGQGSQAPAGGKQGSGESVAAGGIDVPVDPQALYAQAAEQRDDNIPLGNSQMGNGYKMRLMLTNRGAGIVSADLTEYAESVTDPEGRYRLLNKLEVAGAVYYSLQSQKVVVNWDSKSQQVALGEVNWNWQTSQGEGYQEVDFWIRCSDSSGDVLEIHKIYRLAKGSRDVELSIRLKNLTDQQSCQVVLTQLGPLGLRRESSRVDQRMVFAGYRAAGAEVLSIYQTTRKTVLKEGKSHTLGAVDQQAVWLGSTNQYFAALLAVVDGADQPGGKSVIAKTSAVSFSLDKDRGDDFMVHWVTVPVKLSAGLEAQMSFEMYLGPKSVEIFEAQDRYGQLNYQGTIQYPWCTMQWLAELMGKLLKLLFKVTHNYGLAIILMVIIVRVLLHPVTKSSQTTLMKAQRDMQKLQPKMQALKKKYSDNREALNKATMDLYKQEGINPAGQVMGCLPMMLQMPIWFALYTTLYTTFELRHQPFFGWIRDLAGPDALIHFSQPFTIPLVSAMLGPIEYFNVLPILLGVSMLLMQKFMPKPTPPPGSGPDQAKQQKIMMYFMSGFIALVLYNAPSGLNLYILTSNLLGSFENHVIKKHIKEQEAAAASKPDRPKPKSKFMRWLQQIEKITRKKP